ncbi:MAG: efflux transporter outer membrane subunit [Acidobacteriaceae bacterium]
MRMSVRNKAGMRWMAVGVMSGLLAGCTVGPKYRPPNPPTVRTYTLGPQPPNTVSATGPGGEAQHFNCSAEIPAQWWKLFHSEKLDELVSTALDNNPTLAQAEARLREAQEDVRAQTGATQYPSVDAKGSAQREQLDLRSLGLPATIPNPGPFTLYNVSLNFSYGLDLFGANRRELEALKAKVDYQRFELEAARISLASNVVSAVIRQASLRARIADTQTLLQLQKEELAIVEKRYRDGGLAASDVESLRTTLAQACASLPPLQKQLSQVNDQLAVYLGKAPAEVRPDAIELSDLHLPAELPLALPSSLAQQRPDIRAAEALLHQASANVGVATANLFPQIMLSASAGSQATGVSDLANSLNVWNFGGNLLQPVFHGGELRAEKRKAAVAYQEAGAAYKEAVLQGLLEVADALQASAADARTLQAKSDAANHAHASYGIARRRYDVGGISYFSLLDAKRQYLQTALDRTSAEADRYADSVALLHALGGGWWNIGHNPAISQSPNELLPYPR